MLREACKDSLRVEMTVQGVPGLRAGGYVGSEHEEHTSAEFRRGGALSQLNFFKILNN